MNFLSLDNQIFTLIHSLTGQNILMDWLGIFCAKYLIWIMLAIFFVWWLELAHTRVSRNWPLLGKRKWLELGTVLLSIAWAVILNQVLSLIHFRPRPFVSHTIQNLVNTFSTKSFPSDHASLAFALAVAVFFYNKKIGSWLLVMGLLVGLARIFAGVHYPLDVVGGAVVGVIAAGMVRWIFISKK